MQGVMMDWLEQKYINLLSNRLRNFKRKGPNLYNFSCVFCGDSDTKKNKARGYIYEKKGKSSYYCHNCGASYSVSNFIKMVDQNLYNEMQIERLKEKNKPLVSEYDQLLEKVKKPVIFNNGPLNGLKKVSELSSDHPIKKLVNERMIPDTYHTKLYECPNFMHFVNNLIPDKFSRKALDKDEMRLLIPFFDKDKNLHAFQGRSLDKHSQVKYITIVLDESTPKVYGLDTVNLNKSELVPVLEGPIDSMFVENSIATAGGDIVSTLQGFNKENLIIVYDNEPRSKETIKKLDKAILNGYNVCIWPENLEHKDINDMILAGFTKESIYHIIKENTYKDLSAKLAITKWRKI